jgi:hypothetical protein
MRLTLLFALCGALLAATGADAAPMTFTVVNVGCPHACSKALLGQGEIVYTTDRAFRAARRRTGNLPVLLHSPGGDLSGGLNLGLAFRAAKSSVAVAPGGDCISSCAYALFGGVTRKVLRGGRVGLHEFVDVSRHRPDWRQARDRKIITRHLLVYAGDMGVSTKAVELALKTPYGETVFLSRWRLRNLRIVTASGF